jgi:hypothetical protein
MPRGGRRPGAGAPRGNLNAYKHGRNSTQHNRLAQIIAADPEAFALLREFAERDRRRRARENRKAIRLVDNLFRAIEYAAQERALTIYENNQAIPPIPNTDRWANR